MLSSDLATPFLDHLQTREHADNGFAAPDSETIRALARTARQQAHEIFLSLNEEETMAYLGRTMRFGDRTLLEEVHAAVQGDAPSPRRSAAAAKRDAVHKVLSALCNPEVLSEVLARLRLHPVR